MLSDSFLRRLDALALRVSHQAGGGSGGLRRSRSLGSSVEFSDFREYLMGDDIRRVDWNAYARFERLFIKLFMEEREQRVNLIVDASASMGFGEPAKWQAAVQMAEALGYMALCGGDSVTVYALGDTARHTRALHGRHGYPELSDFLESVTPCGQARLNAAVPMLPLPSGRGMSVLIGDMLSEDGYDRAVASLIYRRQETAVVQLLSHEEWEPTLESVAELEDSETGETFLAGMGYDLLRRYREAAARYVSELREHCVKRGAMYELLLPGEDFEQDMLRALSRAGLIG